MPDIIIPNPTSTPDSRELKVLRKQTHRFIAENPEDVTLRRNATRTGDGAGGWTTTPGTPIPPQRVRLVIQGGNVASRNLDGEEVSPAYVMLAEYDADVEIGDVFTLAGRDYKIHFVREDRDYEVWAEVIDHG